MTTEELAELFLAHLYELADEAPHPNFLFSVNDFAPKLGVTDREELQKAIDYLGDRGFIIVASFDMFGGISAGLTIEGSTFVEKGGETGLIQQYCKSPQTFVRIPSEPPPAIDPGRSQTMNELNQKAFQDFYPDELSYCYGCGRLNAQGLKLKSHWDGKETVAMFSPQPYHIAIPGYVYGGLIASIMDCHGTGTAAAATYDAEGREMGTEPSLRFVTASLQVEYIRPTPLGVPLEIRGKTKEVKGRRVVVSVIVSANGEVCAKGEVIAVQMPEHMMPKNRVVHSGKKDE